MVAEAYFYRNCVAEYCPAVVERKLGLVVHIIGQFFSNVVAMGMKIPYVSRMTQIDLLEGQQRAVQSSQLKNEARKWGFSCPVGSTILPLAKPKLDS